MAQQHCSPPKTNVPLVIDNGSLTIKAGYAGDQSPRLTVPTVVGRSGDKVYVGEEIKGKEGLTLEYPIVRGTIKNWDGMTEVKKFLMCTKNLNFTVDLEVCFEGVESEYCCQSYPFD